MLVLQILLVAAHAIAAQVSDPVISAAAGPTQQTVSVTVTDVTPGATIYYTTDGSTPTTSSATVVSGSSIVINQNASLKVQAYQGSATPSSVVSGKYSIGGLLSAGPQHTLVLKNDGTAWAWGNNVSGQLGNGTTTNSSTPVKITLNGVTPIGGLLSKNVSYENGLPIWWQIAYLGQTGNDPTALAPNGTGKTLLQCYQQSVDPRQATPAEPLSVSVSATGPYQAPAQIVLVAGVTHPSSTTIQRVDFYQNSILLGSATQAPYQVRITSSNPGTFTVWAIAYDSTGAAAAASTQFQVLQSNRYNRGWGTDQTYLSSIIAVDAEKGVALDGITDFTTLYAAGQYPWFLRTRAETGEPWKHIVTSGTAGTYYNQFNYPPLASGTTGTATGGVPPMVAFGSQGGGSSLYVNQSYNFGVAAGGQLQSGTTNADIKVEVYQKSDFASGAINVAPVYTGTFTLPRTSSTTAWTAFVNNGYVQDYHIIQSYNGKTIDFDTQVQYVTGVSVTDTWGQPVQYPLMVSHKTANSSFFYKVSYMGITTPDGTNYPAMALNSPLNSQVYNVTYTLDFNDAAPWQSSYIGQPHFQSTPLPSAYQGKSVDELIHNTPAVTDTLTAPGSTGLNLTSVDNSPDLRKHPVLDKFVSDMGNDPMALANYVLNEIELTDAIGYNTSANCVTDQSLNPQGVSRDALATFLEGQGSPAEQCALLIYFLRQCKNSDGSPIACGYIFPSQDATLMFDQQLSKLLRMQIRGANGSAGGLNAPELIPVNYPWVAAYINGAWIHIFPWLKDTAVEEGLDLWNYMPNGYQTGGQFLQRYLLNDTTIRGLSTEDNLATLFPLYLQNQLKNTGVSLDDLGMNIYNRRNYFTRWQDFPRPWATGTVGNANLAQNLDASQNPSALTPVLQNIFDTVTIQIISDRNNNGQADAGEPVLTTGTMRMVDLHDRRLLLYHQVVQGTNPTQYKLILSLESFSSAWTSSTNTFLGTSTFNGVAHTDPGYLCNKQTINTTLQTTTDANNDDTLLYKLTYNRHRQAQSVSVDHWTPFLGLSEVTTITDTRYLRKGDMACLCTNYGRVTQKMQEFQAEKYWNYQQTVAANPSAAVDPELANGQLLFVMGQSFYYKLSQFIQNVENWTKTRTITWTAHGLSKLSPQRNTDGTPNIIQTGTNNSISDINLRYPRVDMAYQRAAWAGNSTSHLDSGDEENLACNGAMQLIIGEGSADEHRVLNEFFQQSAAISTVKLLDIAQGWTPTSGTATHPGTGPIMLTSANYLVSGSANYTVTKTSGTGTVTKSLSAWAGGTSPGSLWSQVTSALTDPNYGSQTTVYITPGPLTAPGQQGQAYTGVGGMVIGVGYYGAFITDNMVINNGGYAGDTGYNIYSYYTPPAQVNSTILVPTSDYGYTAVNTTTATYTAPITINTVPIINIPTVSFGLSNNTITLNTDQTSELNSWSSLVSSTPTTYGSSGLTTSVAETKMISGGNIGSNTTWYGSMFNYASSALGTVSQAISDPVNAVTGEFYVNTCDLRLNGPMPLEIRRIYGSLNQADNNYGHGWRMSYFPYLMLSSEATFNTANTQVTTPPSLIYASEMDGSVIAYRSGTSAPTTWRPSAADNPNLANSADGSMGGLSNPFNNRIDQTTVSGTTVYTLTGADGNVRVFNIQAFPITSGTTTISRARPYLQKWTDNRGNYYTFTSGTSSTSTDYGLVNRIQSSNGNSVSFYYDTYGHIIDAFAKDGRHLYYQYDTYGDLTQVILPDASTISYAYQHSTTTGTNGQTTPYSTHLITQETKPEGRILQNTYDPANSYAKRQVLTQLSTVGTNQTPIQNASFNYGTPTKNADGITYDGSTTITDVNGNTTTYTYIGNQITQVNSPPQNNGSVRQNISQAWFTNKNLPGYYQRSLQSRTDKRGLITNYQYDSQGNLVQLTVNGNLTGGASNTETATTSMTYNNSTQVTLPGSGVSTIPNTLASVTDALGNGTQYVYGDSAHPYLPTSISKIASGGTVSTTLLQYQNVIGSSASAYGILQMQTTAAGTSDRSVVQFTNSANGFPVSKTQFTGSNDPDVVINYTYNLRGELKSETDAAGRSTQYGYDARGNRTASERYDEWGNLASWNYVYYNQNGEVEWVQGPRYSPNDYLTKRYDGAGRLKEEDKWLSAAMADGSGVTSNGYASTFYAHDTFGNLTQVVDPNQNTTTMTYDAIGEMITRQTPNGSNTASETFTYEPGGLVATHITVLGGTESSVYTSTGLIKSSQMADSTTLSYLYDLTGRVVRETLTNGSYWATAYDDLSRKITRTFYNAGSTLLASEIQNFDRRGNLVSKTDVGGNTYISTYDGLNRLKKSTGPGASPDGTTAQQSTFHVYDSAGVVHTVINGTGERTISYIDAEGRTTLVSTFNSDGSAASNTSNWYSPDHQSVVTTAGSGTNAITNTQYTDTLGRPVLLIHADGTFQATAFDKNGNRSVYLDEQGAITKWTYDSLNHLLTETLPASSSGNAAIINYIFDAAGNLRVRQMPTGQAGAYVTGTTGYDPAGRKTSEKLLGTDGSVTRSFNFHYYGSGVWKGLFQSADDPRGFTTTTTYDDWLHPLTINSVNTTGTVAQQNQNTTYGYDVRGMVTSIDQSYASGTTGPPTKVTRAFDSYGQLNSETVAVSGTTVSQWKQSWDAAGRRNALNWQLPAQGSGWGSQYYFGYNATGRVDWVVNSGLYYGYTYGDNNLLQQRATPSWTQNITSRDNRGRVLTQNVASSNATLISESLQWRGDSRLDTYSIATNGWQSESRTYSYDKRGRVLNEPFLLTGTQQAASYFFDQAGGGASLENGLGVRTLQQITSNTGYQVNSQTKFQQPTQDLYAPSSSSTQTYNFGYDSAGNLASRGLAGDGTQYFVWDAWGRLMGINVRDASNNGSNWTTVYDGLGRRVQTTFQYVSGGTPYDGTATLQYYYDPQVEFLELGINSQGSRQWKVYGPDVNGVYGGQQGTGGLQAVVTESSGGYYAELNNYFGDAIGTYGFYNGTNQPRWWTAALGGYGALPGSTISSSVLDYQWRGHYLDWSGFYYMGSRYYDPLSGRFLSPDPLGHAASMSLYDYANGDPVNRLDSDGRFGKQAYNTVSTEARIDYGALQNFPQQVYYHGADDLTNFSNAADQALYNGINAVLHPGETAASFGSNLGSLSFAIQNDPQGTFTGIKNNFVQSWTDPNRISSSIGSLTGNATLAFLPGATLEVANAANASIRASVAVGATAESALTRAFWVGTDGEAAAQASGAQLLKPSQAAVDAAKAGDWSLMRAESAAWARGASGDVPVFFGNGKGRIFLNDELPELLKNMDAGKVKTIQIDF